MPNFWNDSISPVLPDTCSEELKYAVSWLKALFWSLPVSDNSCAWSVSRNRPKAAELASIVCRAAFAAGESPVSCSIRPAMDATVSVRPAAVLPANS